MNIRPVVVGVKPDQHPAIVEYALLEARRLGAPLRAVHVAAHPGPVPSLAAEFTALVTSIAPLAEAELVTVSGPVVEVLQAESRRASLVVVGADDVPWHARSSGAEIAHGIAMVAASPVVVVPRADLAARRTSSVVVAVDDDGDMDAQLTFAFTTAQLRDQPLNVVYGAGAMSDYPGRLAHLSRLESHVDRWRARFPGVNARTSVEGGSPEDACLDARLHASVLVLGQPTGLHPRLLSRSFAAHILRDSPAPVVVVPLDHDRSPAAAHR